METSAPAEPLTLHQKISLKGIIQSKKERDAILSHRRDDEWYKAIYAIALFWNWNTALKYFFSGDLNDIPVMYPEF